MFHQVSHEILDSEKENNKEEVAENIFFLASSLFMSGIIMNVSNIELFFSTILVTAYTLSICWFVHKTPAFNYMFVNFLQATVFAILAFAFLNYAQINSLRHGFEVQQKVKRLLLE